MKQRRRFDQTFGDQLRGEPKVATVEYLHLRLHAQLLDPLGHGAQHIGRLNDHRIAVAEIQRAAVQGANFRFQRLDVGQALGGVDHVAAGVHFRWIVVIDVKVTTHARGQVDDRLAAAGAQPFHHLAIEGHVAAALAGLRITHVTVNHGRPGGFGLETGLGDLAWGHGNGGVFVNGVTGAGNGTGDNDLTIHAFYSKDDALAPKCVGKAQQA